MSCVHQKDNCSHFFCQVEAVAAEMTLIWVQSTNGILDAMIEHQGRLIHVYEHAQPWRTSFHRAYFDDHGYVGKAVDNLLYHAVSVVIRREIDADELVVRAEIPADGANVTRSGIVRGEWCTIRKNALDLVRDAICKARDSQKPYQHPVNVKRVPPSGARMLPHWEMS